MSKKVKEPEMKIAYKAFDQNWKCRGFQYEVGKSYEHKGDLRICESGFHSCENPLDVLSYYNLCESKFALVEVGGETKTHNDDSKICSSKITLKAELSIGDFITASLNWTFNGWFKEAINNKKNEEISKEDFAKQAASGKWATQAASGKWATQAASGYGAKQAASGDGATQAASGDGATQAASGYGAKQAASGYGATQAASGDGAKQAASGKWAKQAASGYGATQEISGEFGIACALHKASKVKGCTGTLICLVHYDGDNPVKFVTGKIGEGGLLPETWYGLDNDGNFKAL